MTKLRSPSSSHRPPEPEASNSRKQLDDFALLAKLDPVAAVGDELACRAHHIDDQDSGIGDHQPEHRRASQPQGQRYAADRQDADVEDRRLRQRNQRDAARAHQRGHDHAHEDLLAWLGGIEPEQRRNQPHRRQQRDQQADRAGLGRILLGIFGIMPKPNRTRAAHEAEQQGGPEPYPQLEIVGGVAKADHHHRRGQDLDRDRCRNQPDERIDLRLADRLADPVTRRLQREQVASIATDAGRLRRSCCKLRSCSAHAMPFRLASR